MSTELAEMAYNAYGEDRGWKTFDGGPMPSWEDQNDALKQAWRAAAAAVGSAGPREGAEPRQGLFLPDLPDFDAISERWRELVMLQSSLWQARLDEVERLLSEVLAELRSIKGVTVTIDRDHG